MKIRPNLVPNKIITFILYNDFHLSGIAMIRNKIIFLLCVWNLSCMKESNPFVWVDSLPVPWLLSETEFESYLPRFQEKFPNYHDRLKALNLWRVGTPYGLYCLGEEVGQDPDPLLRVDSSDCTVHVLTTIALAESYTWQNARDAMVDIHYKMDENGLKEPTYKSRWHYTSDRLLHHDRTINITSEISSQDDLETVAIELNKKQDGTEFLKLDWTSQEKIQFLPTEKATKDLLRRLPSICGVAFVKRSYFKMGIVVAHEGYIIDRKNLIHASSVEKKTVNVDFLSYLENNGEPRFDGIIVYEIRQG